MKSGILVDANDRHVPEATLTMNDSGRFEDRWVRLGVESEHSVFLRGIERMELPVAHAEGKFVPRDETTLEAMRQAGRLVLRYRAADETASDDCPYPDNPNGSVADIAGVADRTGRVLGLMPHPERHVTPLQHPRWTRGEAGPVGDGLAVFQNAVTYFG
jgi:phosphoribosylformylglycinamidine synthase